MLYFILSAEYIQILSRQFLINPISIQKDLHIIINGGLYYNAYLIYFAKINENLFQKCNDLIKSA